MVNVGVDSKESFENGFNTTLKMGWKLDTNFARKESLVVQLVLDPGHQVVNVLGGRALDWFLHHLTVRPMVFVFRSS